MLKTDTKTYLVLGATLIAGVLLGYLLGYAATKNKAYQSGFLAGSTDVETEYQQKIGELFPEAPEPEEIFSVLGRIKDIQGKTLILEEIVYFSNPFKEPEIKTWKVNATDSTSLLKRVEKTAGELIKERELLEPGEEIVPYWQKAIEFSELVIGQDIKAESQQNIKGKSEFDSSRVVLLPLPGTE